VAGDDRITSVEQLRGFTGEPAARVLAKEVAALSPRMTSFIASSPFVVIATAGADGSLDVSPKGGPPGFVRVVSAEALAIPDFPGNRRFDGVQNLVHQPGIGLLFMVPGIGETLRVNGVAELTRDPQLREACAAVDGRLPWFVISVQVRQAFSHCGKAFLRAGIWQPRTWPAPDSVTSPSATIVDRSRAEQLPESAVRDEVEEAYRDGLY
jgi:uncharacterized protein